MSRDRRHAIGTSGFSRKTHTRHDDRFSEFFTNAIREIRRNRRCRRPDRRRMDGDDRVIPTSPRPSTRRRRFMRGRRVYRCAPRRTSASLKFTRRNLSNIKNPQDNLLFNKPENVRSSNVGFHFTTDRSASTHRFDGRRTVHCRK